MIRPFTNQQGHDPFLCSCTPCKQFWKQNFRGSRELLTQPGHMRAAKTAITYGPTNRNKDHSAVLRIGDQVLVKGAHKGIVRYIGVLDENLIATETYVGVQLFDNVGSSHNGVINGKRYFHCPRGHGALVKYHEVTRIRLPNKWPPLSGNYMYPSHKEIMAHRKERSTKDPKGVFGPLFKHGTSPEDEQVPAMSSKTGNKSVKVKYATNGQIRKETLQKLTTSPTPNLCDTQRHDMAQLRQQFGGGKRGEVLALTLQKLKKAYQEGLQYSQTVDDHQDESMESKTIKSELK